MDEARRHEAERLGVVRHHRALCACRHHLLGARAVPGEDLPVGGHREAPRRALGEQRALGRLALLNDHAQLAVRSAQPGDVRGGAGPEATAQLLLGLRSGRSHIGVAKRVLQAPQRVAQLVLAEDLAHTRAVGLAHGLRGDVEFDRHVALHGRQALGHARVLGVLDQVLFALGPFDLVDVREHVLQPPEALDQLAGGLVADAGNAGDVVRGVSLQAVEVGDHLGGNPVAIDDRLTVVDLRLGDPPRGRHHLDQPLLVDQLEDVTVARHDHHRHRRARPSARARSETRSRRRPHSPPRARCCSRTPPPAVPSPATAA